MLEKGTKIHVVKSDDTHWELERAMDIEFDGQRFIGCEKTHDRSLRWTWKRSEVKRIIKSGIRCNIDGMVEQLTAEGLI